MGIPGVLVGPVIVAFFLALYTIYLEDFLGFESEPVPQATPGMMEKAIAWFKGQRDTKEESELAEPTEEVDGSEEAP